MPALFANAQKLPMRKGWHRQLWLAVNWNTPSIKVKTLINKVMENYHKLVLKILDDLCNELKLEFESIDV
jgi:hypothetical protein